MGVKKDLVKYGTIGYIVGYDGQKPGGEVPKGSYVFPEGGINGVGVVYDNEVDALSALGTRTTYTEASLVGQKVYVLKVHKIKVSWFPFAAQHIGYRKPKSTKVTVNA